MKLGESMEDDGLQRDQENPKNEVAQKTNPSNKGPQNKRKTWDQVHNRQQKEVAHRRANKKEVEWGHVKGQMLQL
jgi:hypothetical protein